LKASYAGSTRAARLLLTHRANAKHKDYDGWTALHNAASRGHIDIANLLIKYGADINAQSRLGFTPLSEYIFLINQSFIVFLFLFTYN